MPGHRRNSLKDSVRKVLGTYSDPLLPPGGLPLPFHIRRKFSFAPQLPDISRLSLIHGFTASQYSLGDDAAEEGQPKSPRTSLIRASPSKIQLVIYEQEKQPAKQPAKRPAIEHPIFYATINDLARLDSSSTQTIRKIRGQVNLKRSTPETDSIAAENHRSSRDATPPTNTPQQTRLPGKKVDGPRLNGTEAANEPGKRATAILDSPIAKHSRIIPNFLRSLYIIDPHLPGNPINVMSRDMIPPQDLQDGEGLFLDLSKSRNSADLLTRQAPDGAIEYQLVFSTDLVSQETGQTRYQMIAQVNVTHLLTTELLEAIWRSTAPTNQDETDPEWTSMDWFELAHNELLNAGQKSHFGPFPPRHTRKPRHAPSESPSITALTEALKPFYADFFVLQRSPTGTRYFNITYLSRSVFDSGEQACDDPLKHTAPETTKAFGRALAREEEIALQIRWGEKGVEKWLYCVPMFGPRLGCFICLLLDGHLPDFWEE